MKPPYRTLFFWLSGSLALLISHYYVSAESSDNDNNTSNNNTTCSVNDASRWSEQNVYEVLRSWKFSPQEEKSLFELKDRLEDIDHWKNDPAELSRFIKEHNFDVDKAERMFRGMIEWRLENNVDGFVERYQQPPEPFLHAPIFLIKGLDKENDPIFVLRIGKLDAWGLYQRLGESAMLEANRFVSELHVSRDVGIPEGWRWQTEYYEKLTGRRVTQFTIIVDLDGLNTQLLRPALFSFLQRTARTAQDHYPGLAKRILLVRSPRIFKMAWNVAKHFFDKRVHHKFVFSNHDDYLDVVGEYLDLEVLPPVMYSEGQGTQMPGFFEKIHMEGGPIPPLEEDNANKDGPEIPPTVSPEVAATS